MSARARASSCTGRPGPAAPRPCSWPSTSAPTSPRSATRRMSSSCARSGPTRSSTTCRRTSRRTARPTTSSWTRWESTPSCAAGARSSRAGSSSRPTAYEPRPRAVRPDRSASRWCSRFPSSTKKDVLLVKELIEGGHYRAVIDRTYPLEDVVEATRYVETWQKTGNVVLTLNGGSLMKAAVRDKFGPPDRRRASRDREACTADDEVLVRVRASSVNMADWYDVTGRPYVGRAQMGLRKPKSEQAGGRLRGDGRGGRQGRHAVSTGRRGVRREKRGLGRVRLLPARTERSCRSRRT